MTGTQTAEIRSLLVSTFDDLKEKELKFRAVCALDGNNQNFQTRHVSNSQQTAEVNNFD